MIDSSKVAKDFNMNVYTVEGRRSLAQTRTYLKSNQFKTAYKQTGGAILIGGSIVVTGYTAAMAPTVGAGIAQMGYFVTDALISPPPASTLGGALYYIGYKAVFQK